MVLASMILASALLARPTGDSPDTGNQIALVVFVVAVLVALAMLLRIALQSRRVMSRRGR
jgi:hypothetical protein